MFRFPNYILQFRDIVIIETNSSNFSAGQSNINPSSSTFNSKLIQVQCRYQGDITHIINGFPNRATSLTYTVSSYKQNDRLTLVNKSNNKSTGNIPELENRNNIRFNKWHNLTNSTSLTETPQPLQMQFQSNNKFRNHNNFSRKHSTIGTELGCNFGRLYITPSSPYF
jgi:hypothetical protein